MDSRDFDQPTNEYVEELRAVLKAQTAREALSRYLDYDDAVYANNLGRLSFGFPREPMADVLTGVVTQRLPIPEHTFTEIARRAEEAGDPGHSWFGLKRGVRTVFAGAESLWENGLPRLTRTAIRSYRGEDPLDAWKQSGGGYVGQMVRANAQGQDYTLGEGFFPAPRNPLDTPGFKEQVDGLVQRGVDPYEAQQRATEWVNTNQPVDVVGETWDAAENTQLYKTRGATTYASPVSLGRIGAIQAFDPGTVPFNLMSGIIDGYTRIGMDPIDVGFDEWRLWRQGRNRIMPEAGRNAGMSKSWRPWLNPMTAEDWFARPEGRRVVDFLSENTSLRETRRLLTEMPVEDQLRINRTKDPSVIRDTLREYFGAIETVGDAPRLSRRQRIFGATLPADERKGVRGMMTNIRNEQVIGKSIHRWLAETGNTVLDPANPSQTLDAAQDWMETALVGSDEIDKVLVDLAENSGDYYGMQHGWQRMVNAFENRVDALGYQPHEEAHIINQMFDDQFTATEYFDNAAGEDVIMLNQKFWEDANGNRHFIPTAHVEAEFQHRAIYMPNVRDIRRATSRWRAFNQKWRRTFPGDGTKGLPKYFQDPLGIDPSALARVLDPAASLWRNFALLRFGWPLRVLPEELIRQGAAGYNDVVRHPASYLAMIFTDMGMTGVADDSLQSVFNAKNLGAGGFARNLANDITSDSRFLGAGKPFSTVRRPTRGLDDILPTRLSRADEQAIKSYSQGLSYEYFQMYSSDTPRLVAQHGIDHTFDYLRNTDEGLEIVKANAKAADPNTPWRQIWDGRTFDDQALRAHLQSMEARIRTNTGGRWYTRIPDNQGNFTTDLWEDQLGARYRTDDIPQLADVGDDTFYFPIEDEAKGRYELRDLIWSGKMPDNEQWLWPEMKASDREAFEDFLVHYESNTGWQRETAKIPIESLDRRTREVYDKFVNNIFSFLMEVPTEKLIRSPFARLEYNRQMARMYVWADEPSRAKIRSWARANGMINPFDDAVKENLKLHNLSELPDVPTETISIVHDPDPGSWLAKAEHSQGEVDRLVTRYRDEIPEWRWNDDPDRAVADLLNEHWDELDEKAQEFFQLDATFTEFEGAPMPPESLADEDLPYVFAGRGRGLHPSDSQLHGSHMYELREGIEQGWMELVEDVPAAFNFEEASAMAKYTAAEKTRELFYDLQRRGNWADMSRLVFPFADAWWEVLSRWAKFLDPTGIVPGQTLGSTPQSWRNIRRLGTGLTAARRVGFFDEDQYGNEVFNFPALGVMGLPGIEEPLADVEGARLRGQASLDALMFIDPTARGFAAPGGGYWSQLAAHYVTPKLPKPLADAVNWVAWGDFAPAKLESVGDWADMFLPTYGRRFSEMLGVLASGEADSMYADDIMLAATALRLSGDDRYGDASPDQQRRTVEAAQIAGSTLGLLRMFEAFFTPAQPQYLTEALVEVMDLDGELREVFMDVAALNQEWQQALETFDDDEIAAARWWQQTYGFDPLNLTAKSKFIKDRPTTESEGFYRDTHPEIEVFNSTMMMWVPDYEELEDLDQAVWQRQFDADEKAREKLTATTSIQLVNARKAWKKIENLRETRDVAYEDCEGRFAKGSSKRVACREAVRGWYNGEMNKVTASDGPYWALGIQGEGTVERPTYGSQMEEILAAATPGTDSFGAASKLNPELHGFVKQVKELWDQAEAYGASKNNQTDWWLTVRSDEAQVVRDWFAESVAWYGDELERTAQPATMDGVTWMIEHVLTPLLEGWEWDDEIWFMPEEPPAPIDDGSDRPDYETIDGPFIEEGPA